VQKVLRFFLRTYPEGLFAASRLDASAKLAGWDGNFSVYRRSTIAEDKTVLALHHYTNQSCTGLGIHDVVICVHIADDGTRVVSTHLVGDCPHRSYTGDTNPGALTIRQYRRLRA
jgi:hypothetical protein